MRRKNQTTNEPEPAQHFGNGTLPLTDVLNYFKGKTIQERETIFEAIRAMGSLGWTNVPKKRGRPSLKTHITA